MMAATTTKDTTEIKNAIMGFMIRLFKRLPDEDAVVSIDQLEAKALFRFF